MRDELLERIAKAEEAIKTRKEMGPKVGSKQWIKIQLVAMSQNPNLDPKLKYQVLTSLARLNEDIKKRGPNKRTRDRHLGINQEMKPKATVTSDLAVRAAAYEALKKERKLMEQ